MSSFGSREFLPRFFSYIFSVDCLHFFHSMFVWSDVALWIFLCLAENDFTCLSIYCTYDVVRCIFVFIRTFYSSCFLMDNALIMSFASFLVNMCLIWRRTILCIMYYV